MSAKPKDTAAEYVALSTLRPWKRNPRKNKEAISAVARSIESFGFGAPIVARREDSRIIAGHTRYEAAKRLAMETVPVRFLDVTEEQANALALADNKLGEIAEWDDDQLKMILAELRSHDAELPAIAGWSDEELAKLLDDVGPSAEDTAQANASLAERFLVPPFSVLDARQGYWQARKKAWIATGISSADGRDVDVWNLKERTDDVGKKIAASVTGIASSVFDPVLCELAYLWFCPPGGTVLDPFAGGSVRGLVASKLSRHYVGVDLRSEQVEANRAQLSAAGSVAPQWIVGDSRDIQTLAPDVRADLVFSCPPYGDLERYSDDPRDISTMNYEEFAAAYRSIIAASVAMLRPDRFACFVVGDIRDKRGFYRSFVSDTIAAFESAGARFYNDAVLVTAVASTSLRAGKQFTSSRKLGKTHQNVLVFCKGDPKRATEACGEVDVLETLDATSA